MAEDSIYFPILTLTQAELDEFGDYIDALPEPQRKFVRSADVASYLRTTIRPAFGLSSEQERGVARFIMEVALGRVSTAQMAPELSRIAGVDTNTALQIVKELETDLLAPLGLTLTGLASPTAEPELVVDAEGREGLRYSSADDLLEDIEGLTPGDRDQFLADAKRDNRIIVLQILSQLKLGADSGGRPLSFRQLIAAEADDFDAAEWADLARTDPDALAEPDVWRHISQAPLGAMLQGREPAAAHDVVLQFSALDEDAQRIAVDPKTSAAVQELVRGGLVPATHATAIGRIIFFVLTGQATPGDAADLLKKVGLNAVAADAAARTVSAVTAPIVPAPAEDIVPTAPAVPAAPRNPGLNVPNTPSRTIIDLRKPQP